MLDRLALDGNRGSEANQWLTCCLYSLIMMCSISLLFANVLLLIVIIATGAALSLWPFGLCLLVALNISLFFLPVSIERRFARGAYGNFRSAFLMLLLAVVV